jgi:hypothetical protein
MNVVNNLNSVYVINKPCVCSSTMRLSSVYGLHGDDAKHYLEPLWSKLAEGLTILFNDISSDRILRVELGQTNIIFNIPHPSLLLHIHDKTSRNAILLLIQEVKRDIIFRRMNLLPSTQQITDPRRLAAHLDSTIRRLRSYLQYIELVKYMKAADLLLRLQEFNLA